MIFRKIDNLLYKIDIEIDDERKFVQTQSTAAIHYIYVNDGNLPQNPYPVDPEYKIDETGDVVLDTARMLDTMKQSIVKNINNVRDYIIEQGFPWTKTVTNNDGSITKTTYIFGLSQFDVNGLISLAVSVLLGATDNLFFISKNNETVSLSADEAKSLALTAEKYYADIVYKSRMYKDSVLAAKTFEELFEVVSNMENDESFQSNIA